MDYIYIPINTQSSTQAVGIHLSELPDEAENLIEVLVRECAPFSLWLECARAYLSQGKVEQALEILQSGTSEDTESNLQPQQYSHERVEMLCALADHSLSLARAAPQENASEHTNKAIFLLNKARKLEYDDMLIHIGLGQANVVKGDMDTAQREFTLAAGPTCLCKGQKNVAGKLALAVFLFNQSKFSEAKDLFIKALSEHPGGPADIRLGLGNCYYRLGDHEKAKAAFERVLVLDPQCAEAMVGLAVIHFNTGAKGTKEGLQLLCEAYRHNPHSPVVLNLLARHSLVRGHYDKVIPLAEAAASLTEQDSVRAEALTYLARTNHALATTQSLQSAFQQYQEASRLDKQAALPILGLAQLTLLNASYRANAAALGMGLLEDALKLAPGWVDALQVLGALLPSMPDKAAAVLEQFKAAAEKKNTIAEVWETLGELQAEINPPEALKAYKASLELYRARLSKQPDGLAEGLPARLLNNAAVMHMRAGEYAAALELVEEAQKAAADPGEHSINKVSNLTLAYNSARIKEAVGQAPAAKKEYQILLNEFPNYLECYWRLAAIERKIGHREGALAWVRKGLEIAPEDADGRAMLAHLLLDGNDHTEAKELLGRLAQDYNNESCMYLGLGVLAMRSAPTNRRKPEDAAKAHSLLRRALEHFNYALRKDSGNIYAANGIAAAYAELGDLGTARTMFTQIQETVLAQGGFLTMPSVAINLANVELAEAQFAKAIQLYQSTLSKEMGTDQKALLYLARAYYDNDLLSESRGLLVRAIHINPADPELRFNIAVTLQNHAVRTFQKKWLPGDPTKLEEFRIAQVELRNALSTFANLSKMMRSRDPKRPGFIEHKKLSAHITFCDATIVDGDKYVEEAEKESKLLEAERQAQLHKLEEAQHLKELEEERRRLEANAREEERARKEAETVERMRNLTSRWREEKELEQGPEGGAEGSKGSSKRKRGKGGKASISDLAGEEQQGGDEEEEEEEEEEAEYEGGPEEEGEDGGTGGAVDDEDLFGDDDEDEAPSEGQAAAQEPSPPKPKKLKGRLKRPRDSGEGEEEVDADADHAMADEDSDGAEEGGEGAGEPGVKRSRVARLDDSDDE